MSQCIASAWNHTRANLHQAIPQEDRTKQVRIIGMVQESAYRQLVHQMLQSRLHLPPDPIWLVQRPSSLLRI